MNGLGKFTWPDGSRYEGEYKDDLKHGFGTFFWADHKKWTGFWIFGMMQGIGTLVIKGSSFKGEWDNGKIKRLNIII